MGCTIGGRLALRTWTLETGGMGLNLAFNTPVDFHDNEQPLRQCVCREAPLSYSFHWVERSAAPLLWKPGQKRDGTKIAVSARGKERPRTRLRGHRP